MLAHAIANLLNLPKLPKSATDRAIVWHRYVLACAGYHWMHLPGDFVDCGAYYGSGIKTVVDYLGARGFSSKPARGSKAIPR